MSSLPRVITWLLRGRARNWNSVADLQFVPLRIVVPGCASHWELDDRKDLCGGRWRGMCRPQTTCGSLTGQELDDKAAHTAGAPLPSTGIRWGRETVPVQVGLTFRSREKSWM